MSRNMDNPDPSRRWAEGATTIPARGVGPNGPKCSAPSIRWVMIWSRLIGNNEQPDQGGDGVVNRREDKREEVARIQLTQGLVEGSAKVGYDTIRFTTAAGAAVECQPSPWIKEGEAYLVPQDGSVKRIGAVDIQLGGPADSYNCNGRFVMQVANDNAVNSGKLHAA